MVTRAGAGVIGCVSCEYAAPVVDGIPRFVTTPLEETSRRTQESFGYEWTHFSDWRNSGATNFDDYFQGLDLSSLSGQWVLDAGCGMGRHARHIARHAGRVVAVDFSRAIDQAARNTADVGNVACLQADLLALPLADAAFDFVYSLGVLHHLEETDRAIAALVRKVRPGGRLRVYLYWKREGWSADALRLVAAVRRVTTRMPFALLRACCWVLSAGIYGAVVVPYRVLSRFGVQRHSHWPLFVYTKYPFVVLYNDQFDRFSAPLEKRYGPEEVARMLERAGLAKVQVIPCFGWIGDGVKPQ
jgi:SAM-dependent methyltransferase